MKQAGKRYRLVFLLFLFHGFIIPVSMQAAREKEPPPVQGSVRIVDSLIRLAESYQFKDVGILGRYTLQALSIARKIGYMEGEALALRDLGMYYLNQENFFKALSCFYASYDLYSKGDNKDGEFSALFRITSIFVKINDLPRAEKYLQIAEKMLAYTSDRNIIGLFHLSMAEVLYSKKEYDAAIRNLYLSHYYFNKVRNLDADGRAFRSLGDAFVQKNQYYVAIFNYNLAIEKFSELQNSTDAAILFTRIAHVYHLLGSEEEALEYNFKAYRLRQTSAQRELQISSIINIGSTYLGLGQYDSSLYYLTRGYSLALLCNYNYYLAAVTKQLYQYFSDREDYPNALKYYQEFRQYQTRLMEDKSNTEIRNLEASQLIHEVEASNLLLQKEKDVLKLRIRSHHFQTLILEFLFLGALAIILVIYQARKKNRRSQQELQTMNQQLKKEIAVRSQVESELQRSEQQYRFLAENSVDVISHLDRNLNRLFVSPSCKQLYGYDVMEMMQIHNQLDLIDPDFQDYVSRRIYEMLYSRNPINFTYKAIRKDGTSFWVESTAVPIFEEQTGEVKELVTMVRDVSERMKNEEAIAENARQKELLLHEIHNRVKNNFSVLESLMDIQMDIASNPLLTRSLTDLKLRVRTMSLVHEQLYHKDDIHSIPFDQYLSNLVNIISDAYENQLVSVHPEIQECIIPIEIALPLGLIVNELLTNAFKYAFPGRVKGNIWISLLPSAGHLSEVGKQYWTLTIRDDGIGLPGDFEIDSAGGMGIQIVRILVEQIEGRLEVLNHEGTCFHLTFLRKEVFRKDGNL